ncbi:MAG: sigma-70 family RNA polymerase sigma factor [Bacteroidota bacterium]
MELTYIRQIIAGDTERFGYFVDTYKHMAFTIAFRVVNNHEDAEEVVQDAFVKAYISLHNFRQDSKFSTWLYKIVVNTALSKTRRKKLSMSDNETTVIEEIAIEGIENAYTKLAHEEQKKIINAALDEMNMEDSLLLTLFHLQELSLDEITEITGTPKENIKVKLYRARKKMFTILEKHLGTDLKHIM